MADQEKTALTAEQHIALELTKVLIENGQVRMRSIVPDEVAKDVTEVYHSLLTCIQKSG